MRQIVASLFLCFILTSHLHASDKSEVTASNGVVVTVYNDTFAEKYEYTSPSIKFNIDEAPISSSVFAGMVKNKGSLSGVQIYGVLYYRGSWKFFESAVFRGGDLADYTSTSRNVLSCRYGCSYTEGFRISLTDKQIAERSENGMIPLQLRSKSADQVIVNIPVTHIAAVKETALR